MKVSDRDQDNDYSKILFKDRTKIKPTIATKTETIHTIHNDQAYYKSLDYNSVQHHSHSMSFKCMHT